MVSDGWYCCPACGKHIQRIDAESVIYNTPLYCRPCRVSWYPTIYMGREFDDDTPFTELNDRNK